jgi:hypothetical protein
MVVRIGKSRTKYTTGETFGMTTIKSDVEAIIGLDKYHFDKVRAPGKPHSPHSLTCNLLH